MYGILKTTTNTGLDSELACVFAAPLTVISNQPAYISDTLSLKRRVTSQQVQRWEIETNIAATAGDDSANFLVNSVVNNYSVPIPIRMPQVYRAKTIINTLTITTTSINSAYNNIITITGNLTNIIPIGEFIRFANHTKVYLVTASDTASITISPPLLSAVPSGTVISYGNKVTMFCYYDNSVALGIKYVDGILSDNGSIKLIEAL